MHRQFPCNVTRIFSVTGVSGKHLFLRTATPCGHKELRNCVRVCYLGPRLAAVFQHVHRCIIQLNQVELQKDSSLNWTAVAAPYLEEAGGVIIPTVNTTPSNHNRFPPARTNCYASNRCVRKRWNRISNPNHSFRTDRHIVQCLIFKFHSVSLVRRVPTGLETMYTFCAFHTQSILFRGGRTTHQCESNRAYWAVCHNKRFYYKKIHPSTARSQHAPSRFHPHGADSKGVVDCGYVCTSLVVVYYAF